MTIAIAKDEAFNFIYRANTDAMKAAADVVFFSPLYDTEIPLCDLVYLPGGYPELFAEPLSRNISMRQSIKTFAEKGGWIFGECGGMMYLTRQIESDSHSFSMCNVFPFRATMEDAHLHLGYRALELPGMTVKGHEFHYSEITDDGESEIYSSMTGQKSAKGTAMPTRIYRYKNVIAGYTHWYWAETGFKLFWDRLIACV